jgi:aryl sulfotransferase
MANPAIDWPHKTRELHNHHFDSTIWNGFKFRDGDIVIATYAKSGTTWVQQIVSQLIFNGAEDLPVAEMSPWLDLRVPPKEVKLAAVEAQTHRRFIKTHLPVDALVFSPRAKSSISAAMAATWCGAFTITTPTRMRTGTAR